MASDGCGPGRSKGRTAWGPGRRCSAPSLPVVRSRCLGSGAIGPPRLGGGVCARSRAADRALDRHPGSRYRGRHADLVGHRQRPINQAQASWTASNLPADWRQVRDAWEHYRAASFGLAVLAFTSLLVGTLTDTAPQVPPCAPAAGARKSREPASLGNVGLMMHADVRVTANSAPR